MHIYVGMSGGVDSSLTAALLKEQGHQVTGVYMKNWAQEWSIFDCPWAEDLYDANRVADQLNIPFKVFDLREQYRDKVVNYMLAEYQAGRTPNPDVMCNQEMKFGVFLQLALGDGAEAVATGHYARLQSGLLKTGLDQNKDQSYFLYRIKRSALPKIVMPIGDYQKPQVRQMAADRGLLTAKKKDSQGICFVGKVDLKKFLQQYITTEPGPVIDETGKEIGVHDGALYYTIGQRQGLAIGGGKPFFVVGKDMAKNMVFVTTDPHDPQLWRSGAVIDQTHWLGSQPDFSRTYGVRVRYRAPLVQTKLSYDSDQKIRLDFLQPQRAIAPGQSAVIYQDDLVLGGGIIVSAA
jgi:tRNA-specific 2-thiouridylase